MQFVGEIFSDICKESPVFDEVLEKHVERAYNYYTEDVMPDASCVVIATHFFHYLPGKEDDVMLNKKEVFEHCLNRWGDSDKRTRYFCENYDEWFSQIPEDTQETVLELLELFEYYSQKKANQCLYELQPKLEAIKTFDADRALYTPLVSTKGIVNSSDEYLLTYRQLHDISKFKIVRDIKKYFKSSPEKFNETKSIVIVDDYCGSGESLKTFLANYQELLQNKHIFYLVTYIMEEALTQVQAIAHELHFEIEVVYINKGIRAFDHSVFATEADELRLRIKKESKKLNISKRYLLGKYHTEALVAFYNDTPNNTIGIFWFDSDKYFSIFPREFENTDGLRRPTPKNLKAKKAVRDAQNYLTSIRRAQYE